MEHTHTHTQLSLSHAFTHHAHASLVSVFSFLSLATIFHDAVVFLDSITQHLPHALSSTSLLRPLFRIHLPLSPFLMPRLPSPYHAMSRLFFPPSFPAKTPDFDTTPFSGRKSVVISTASWLGGKNPFLGYSYIVVGVLCLICAVIFIAKQVIAPRSVSRHFVLFCCWGRVVCMKCVSSSTCFYIFVCVCVCVFGCQASGQTLCDLSDVFLLWFVFSFSRTLRLSA